MSTATSDVVRATFERQVESCTYLGSPFTAALCALLIERLGKGSAFGSRILEWPDTAGDDALALRACGALHALTRKGDVPELTAAYPPSDFDKERVWSAILVAIKDHDDWLRGYLDSPPQTNEVARSSVLLGAALTIADLIDMPLQIHEIGTSAGLNLRFDQYQYDLGSGLLWGEPDSSVMIPSEWRGNAPSVNAPLHVVRRTGCDRSPLDPVAKEDADRLLSYAWPDQPERLNRLASAIGFAKDKANEDPVKIDKVDAAEWVEDLFSRPQQNGCVRVLWHTIMWQYLPEKTKARIAAAIEKAAKQTKGDAPLARFAYENDGQSDSARMDLTLWPGGETKVLGRADFHGRWVEWN